MTRDILIVGRTGVGKSSLVNSTFGIDLAPVSAYEPCTKLVKHYASGTPFGDLCLIDTPGLAEDTESRDRCYLWLVRQQVDLRGLDALLYVSQLNDTRFRPEEKRALRLLTECLGPEVWHRSRLMLTFAGSVPAHRRDLTVAFRIAAIEEYLQSLTDYLGSARQFRHFVRAALVDNVVTDWCSAGEPIARWLW